MSMVGDVSNIKSVKKHYNQYVLSRDNKKDLVSWEVELHNSPTGNTIFVPISSKNADYSLIKTEVDAGRITIGDSPDD